MPEAVEMHMKTEPATKPSCDSSRRSASALQRPSDLICSKDETDTLIRAVLLQTVERCAVCTLTAEEHRLKRGRDCERYRPRPEPLDSGRVAH